MKRIILFTILAMALLAPGIMKAQLDVIPNGDFENWAKTQKGKDSLVNWTNTSGIADSVSSVFYAKPSGPIDRPVYDGKYALSLVSAASGSSLVPGIVYIKFAMKNQDPFMIANMAYLQGELPNSPVFAIAAWKHDATPQKSDTCINSTFFLVQPGTSMILRDSIEPWKTINFQLTYLNSTIPDSGEIVILNADPQVNTLDPNSALYIEKMWFASAAATAGVNATSITKNSVSVYPNPFTNTTTIHYNLGISTNVNLSVYDMQGRMVSNLVSGNQPAGAHDATLDGSSLKNGIYFYRLQTGAGVETGKLILNK